MVDVLENPTRRALIARYAQPPLLPGGYAPEQRLVFGGVGWAAHLALDEALGHDRPGPRFYYLDGNLEIMSTSDEHERIKECIGGCVDDYLIHHGVPHMQRGQATMQLVEESGAEPDKSWCLGTEKRVPDIVLEIALTSGNLRVLPGSRSLDLAARPPGDSLSPRGGRRLRARHREPAATGPAGRRDRGGGRRTRRGQGAPRLSRGVVIMAGTVV
jgi:hypothetical protein